MCKFHLEGKCMRGEDCTFAHGEDELKSAPDFTKTRMCQNFISGNCDDANCKFAHNKDEIRKIDPAVAAEVAALRKKRLSERQSGGRRKRRRGGSDDDGSDSSDSAPRLICDRCFSTVATSLGMQVCALCRFPYFHNDP